MKLTDIKKIAGNAKGYVHISPATDECGVFVAYGSKCHLLFRVPGPFTWANYEKNKRRPHTGSLSGYNFDSRELEIIRKY